MFRNAAKRLVRYCLYQAVPALRKFDSNQYYWELNRCAGNNLTKIEPIKLYRPYHITSSSIGQYSYIAQNSWITNTQIGKFCSIGPNLVCGWGHHPTNGISTHPMFYSTLKQNGMTLSAVDKIDELRPVTIGNDVFIGANVVVLNGVTIGDGAVIGAGAVVSKDIPPYAVAVGVPIKVIRYRFDRKKIEALRKIQWWDFDIEKIEDVEKMFFDLDAFIEKCSHTPHS